MLQMATQPVFHTVYKAMNKPLTVAGVERRLFFLALMIGAATFNFFGSLIGGVAMFLALYLFGRWVTATDPCFLSILLRSAQDHPQYDSAKREAFSIWIGHD